jgi:hypothetical protein
VARLLTNEEIEALLAGGPLVSETSEPIRVGDPVLIELDGEVIATGRLVRERGQLRVRLTAGASAHPREESDR